MFKSAAKVIAASCLALTVASCETDGIQQKFKEMTDASAARVAAAHGNIDPFAGTQFSGILARTPNQFPDTAPQVGWPRVSVSVLAAPKEFAGAFLDAGESNTHHYPTDCARIEVTVWQSEKDATGTASQFNFCEPANVLIGSVGEIYQSYYLQSAYMLPARHMQDPSSINRTKGPKVPDSPIPYDGKTKAVMPDNYPSHYKYMVDAVLHFLGADTSIVDRRVWFVNVVPN